MDLSQTNDYLILLIVGTGILFTLSVGLILFFARYQRKLLKQQSEMHQLEQQYNHDLLAASFKSVEDERKRMAEDLHDELGSIFSTLKLKVDQLKINNSEDAIEESKKIINTGISSVRSITHNLSPHGLDMFGLPTAISDFCHKVNQTDMLKINFYNNDKFADLPSDISISVYRIIQEMISNTIKHAEAKEINIHMIKNNDQMHIKYEDDGKGMQPNKLKQLNGHGLKNTESRLRLINAEYNYQTHPGKGLKLNINVPLVNHEPAKN
ncbi:MAG: sensor histidine kinase [Bacteroidia bacterium]|nr:sensor histidine kinase [Bacteroidia bacterium]NNM15855.1 sensor histidine kinase [Bacteroidia bacterium]